jgi:hypothetical protein
MLGRGEALAMLLQSFDAEEFLADGIFGIPRGSGWTSSEGVEDRRYQVGLSAAAARTLRRAPGLDKCGMPELWCDCTLRLPLVAKEAAEVITNSPWARQWTLLDYHRRHLGP